MPKQIQSRYNIIKNAYANSDKMLLVLQKDESNIIIPRRYQC